MSEQCSPCTISSDEEAGSIKTHGLWKVIIYVLLYLLFIFIAQSWITTFIGYYRERIVKKKELDPKDFLTLSIVLTLAFIIAVYIIRPTLPLFK